MSVTNLRTPEGKCSEPKVTVQALLQKKRARQPITALTATDYVSGRLVDEAGIDLVLVGDSLAMTVLGYESTLPITMEEMLHHARSVRRGVQRAFLVADMPFGSYHTGTADALRNAIRFVKEAGAEAVKIEGGTQRAALVAELTRAEIPVVGHIGLTPQSVHAMGGYRVQGRSLPAIEQLRADAAALEGAGAVAIVIEGVPREIGGQITRAAHVPVIGIGAGPECDGQILVFHDVFGLTFGPPAKFVRRFGDAQSVFREGLEQFRAAVTSGNFPADSESYHLSAEVRAELAAQNTEAQV